MGNQMAGPTATDGQIACIGNQVWGTKSATYFGATGSASWFHNGASHDWTTMGNLIDDAWSVTGGSFTDPTVGGTGTLRGLTKSGTNNEEF